MIAFRAKFFLTIVEEDIRRKAERHHDLFHVRRSFISLDAREILHRLCDSLTLLILAHAEYYPDAPLCPWEHGSEALERFFGTSRTVLGNFSYAELVMHLKIIALRHDILLSGKYQAEKAESSGVGCVDSMARVLCTDAEPCIPVTSPTSNISDCRTRISLH